MAKGFKHGSAGAPLNFKVVGNPQPQNPKENTIWVDTDKKITGYEFSATEPEDTIEGMVWISTGTSSTVAFSATKKNPIRVYPVSAKQYVSGKWVDKTAKSYQGGKWVDWWNGELYDNGNQFESITGGWEQSLGNSEGTADVPPVFNSDHIYLNTGYGEVTYVTTKNRVNLSGFKKLSITFGELYCTGSEYSDAALIVCREKSNIENHTLARVHTTTPYAEISDLSGCQGEYYICFVAGYNVEGKINVIKLEV